MRGYELHYSWSCLQSADVMLPLDIFQRRRCYARHSRRHNSRDSRSDDSHGRLLGGRHVFCFSPFGRFIGFAESDESDLGDEAVVPRTHAQRSCPIREKTSVQEEDSLRDAARPEKRVRNIDGIVGHADAHLRLPGRYRSSRVNLYFHACLQQPSRARRALYCGEQRSLCAGSKG